MVHKCFDKKTGSWIKNENMSDQKLAEKLHKPIVKKFKKRKVHSTFIDNIWGADLADMRLKSKLIKEFVLLICFVDIFRKYA